MGAKDHAMATRVADRQVNLMLCARPTEAFTPESLALYFEIRSAHGKFLIQGTTNDKGPYAE